MRLSALVIVLASPTLAPAYQAQASMCGGDITTELSYRLSAPTPAPRIGEKAVVTLTQMNVSQNTVSVWVENSTDPGGTVFPIEVRDEAGKLRPEGHFSLALRGLKDPKFLTSETPINRSGGCVPLRPGESRTYRIEIGRLFDIGSPGAYSVSLVDHRAGHVVKPLSNTVSVAVVP